MGTDPSLEAAYDVLAGADTSMADIAADWAAASEAAVSAAGARRTIAYGERPGLAYDVHLPAGRPRGIVIFLHGGFWLQGSKDIVAFPAPGLTGAGLCYVAVTYGLAPHYSLEQLVANVEAAVASFLDEAPGLGLGGLPVVLAGHSAGAYLAAAALRSLGDRVRPAGTLLISGLFDLLPVGSLSKMRLLGLDAEDCRQLSIQAQDIAGKGPIVLAVGDREPPGFLEQTRNLAAGLGACGAAPALIVARGDDHFSIARSLDRADSPLSRAVQRFFAAAG